MERLCKPFTRFDKETDAMVRIRVGAGIPLEYFPQMAQEAIELALASDEEELLEAFRHAVDQPQINALKSANLIVNQLAQGEENDAIFLARQIIKSVEKTGSPDVSIIRSQLLVYLIPAAVSLGHDNFVNRVTDLRSASALDQSATYALCGQAYLAKGSYEAAAEFLYKAIELAKVEPLIEADLLHMHLVACLKPLGREEEFARIQSEIERMKELDEQGDRGESDSSL